MSYNLPDIPRYDFTEHMEECYWRVKDIQKTPDWYKYMNIKNCPECNAEINNG
jgi:predicted hydrocarbon binding protein